MSEIIDFIKVLEEREDNQPHEISELICLSCFDRWIGVYPVNALMKKMVCKCGVIGKIIKTGQNIQ